MSRNIVLGIILIWMLYFGSLSRHRNYYLSSPAEYADKLQPGIAGIYLHAVNLYNTRGPGEALGYLETAAAPNDPLPEILRFKKALWLLETSRLDKADAAFASIRLNRSLVLKAIVNRAQILMRKGNYRDAILLLESCTQENPDLDEAWYGLAYLQFMTGAHKDALKALQQMAVTPGYYRVVALKSRIEYAMAKALPPYDHETAKQLYLQIARQLNPYISETDLDKRTRILHIDTLKKVERFDLASTALRNLYAEHPHDPDVIKEYAFFCQQGLLYKKAESLFRELDALKQGTNADCAYWLGGILYRQRKYADAVLHLQRAYKLYQGSNSEQGMRNTVHSLGLIDYRVGDFASAKQRFLSVLSAAPSFWQARAGLADVYLQMRDFSSAEKEINYLKNQLPPTYFTLMRLEGTLKKERDYTDALNSYRNQ